jgi:hypothetical protein
VNELTRAEDTCFNALERWADSEKDTMCNVHIISIEWPFEMRTQPTTPLGGGQAVQRRDHNKEQEG